MKKKFSIALSMALMLALMLTSLVLAAQPALVVFTTDAPCAVSVLVTSYTDATGLAGQTASGLTPWTLDTFPSTSATFFYPASVNCGGTIYNFVSASPSSPLTSGIDNSTTTVTGHYALPDNTPPVWTVPSNISIQATGPAGAVVTYMASATDPDDAVSSQSCAPASGATFALGMTTVNCTATDMHGNTGTASFTVTVVDTTVPILTLPANITVDAVSASGAPVNFTASAQDLVDGSLTVTCLPASGSTFPIGTTTVNCSATDSHNNTANGSFTVTVAAVQTDTVPPVLTLPADISVQAVSASGAPVNFTASANDAVDGPVAVTCSPVSGSVFPIGTTTVNCSATDSHNNTANGSFHVTVTALPTDTTPPVLTLPSDMTVEAVSASGATVNFNATANDAVDGPVTVTCSPASGSLFAFGLTTVNCSAADSQGNTASGSFTITVVDTTPPVLTLPANIAVVAVNASGAPVNFTSSANDAMDGPVAVTCSPASGSTFPIGTATVSCSATDSHGNTANGNFSVAVQFAPAGEDCKGVRGHEILQPINQDGSSEFKAGSTIPAKFRVCGADGNDIEAEDTVSDFKLVKIIHDGKEQDVDETVLSTTPDDNFRSGGQQWIFNIDTKNLDAGNTYVYLITLKDGSTIQFQYDLK